MDDFSDDDTVQTVNAFNKKNVNVFELKDFIEADEINHSHKKIAIESAVDQTKAELIICVDADCWFEKNWLRSIANFYFKYKPKFIAAPVVFNNSSSFLSKFQQLDLAGMMLITGAVNQLNIGFMANGANMAFERNAFLAINGFEGKKHIISGDDYILMQRMERHFPKSCKFLKSKMAFAYTDAQNTLKSFTNQRIRWTSKNKNSADWKLNLQLALVLAFNLFLVFTFFLALFKSGYWLSFLLAFASKMIIDFVFLSKAVSFFYSKKLLLYFLPSQICHILYIVFVGIYGNFGKYTWKGRKY